MPGPEPAEVVALEVNDVGLVVRRASASRPEPESPGVALLDGAALLVGTPAAARARTKPRFVNDSFWERLDTEPIGAPFPAELTPADLAFAHLKSLRQSLGGGITEAYLAVPGTWSAAALGLLLSVARAAGFPVVGLIDAAVAAASLGHPGETLLHLDLTRQRAVVTHLVQGEQVARTAVVASDRLGWTAFEDAWAGSIAEQFVRETRFDPLHVGATEQALHDKLPGWLGELGLREARRVTLGSGGREYHIELTRAALVAAAADLYGGLAAQVGLVKRVGERATLLLSARAARIPGLADRLRDVGGLAVEELTGGASVDGVLAHRDLVRREGEALPLVTRLPSGLSEAERRDASQTVAAAPVRGPEGTSARPTHVLHEAAARPIGSHTLAIGTAPPAEFPSLVLRGETRGISRHHCTLHAADGAVVVEDRSSWGTFLNGERVAGRAVVHAGDRLRLGYPGIELLLIALEEGR